MNRVAANAQEPRSDAGAHGSGRPRSFGAIAVVLAAMTLVVLDAAKAGVALPSIAQSLHVTPGMSVWVVIAYQTGLVMALLPCAALGDGLGHRRVFTAGVALFTVASGLCSLAPSMSWLVAARFLQGLGGAAVMSLAVALLRGIVPQQKFGPAIAWNALVVALSTAAGPVIGSAILSVTSWPGLFTANLPLGLAVLFGSRILPASSGTAARPDPVSVVLNAVSFAAGVGGANQLPTRPGLGVLLVAGAILGLGVLVRREMPKAVPLVPFDLLRLRPFRIAVIASVCCFAGQAAAMVALPYHLQHGLGQNALMTGLYMTSWPLAVAATAPVAGCLARRVPASRLCAVGCAFLAAGLATASLWPQQGGPLHLVPCTVLCGLGFGLFNIPNNRTLFLAAPDGRSGAAGGAQGTARLAGQTAGALLMSLLFSVASTPMAPRLGLGLGAGLALLAGGVSALPQVPAATSSGRTRCSSSSARNRPRPPGRA